MVLQIRVGITKWSNFFYKFGELLERGAPFITKWDNYYKVGQYKSFNDSGVY